MLCFSAYNTPARAGQYDNITFGDGSDLTAIAKWWVNDMGGSIDAYFYSEVYSTGSDGSLGNEHICLRDDVKQTYIGRSDVCVNRANDENYTYIQIDQMDWTTKTPDTLIGQTGDIIGNNNWTGCYSYSPSPSWGGDSGGQCPNVNTDTYQINWGYVEQTLSTIGAINDALKQAGVEVTGYTYSWRVKNADANYEDSNGARGQDPLTVTLEIRDTTGKTVFSKTYDYSYWIDTWTIMSGTETFKDPLMGENLSEIELSVTGKDAGYWAGWYGPEFADPVVKLNYRAAIVPDTTVEDLLFSQRCQQDPLSDPLCPSYNDAMMTQIAGSTSIENMTVDTTPITGIQNNTISQSLTTDATVEETLTDTATATATTAADTTATGSDSGTTTATTEPVSSPAEVASVSEPTVQEKPAEEKTATEEKTTETVADATTTPAAAEEKKSTGLSSTQQNALNAASSVANSAISSASDTASASAGIGLSETGGVASELTSVDPTGSTNALGGVAGSAIDVTQTDSSTSTDSSTGALTQTISTGDFSNPGNNDGSDSAQQGGSNDGSTPVTDLASSETTEQSTGSSVDFSTGETSVDTSGNSNTNDATTDVAGLDANTTTTAEIDTTGSSETNDTSGFDVSSVEQSVVEQSAEQAELAAEDLNNNTMTTTTEDELATAQASAEASTTQTFAPGNPIDELIKEMTAAIIQAAADDAQEVAEQSSKESVDDQNKKEDALVSEAQSGSDNEDAKAALLGYNPKIRAYQQEQVYGTKDIYTNQGMYENQKTYDNPNARLFNGASDSLHREMVRSQYDR